MDEPLIRLLAQGNVGAMTVLTQLEEAVLRIVALDLTDMQMSGDQIWVAYKDFCNKDVQKFVQACAERNASMVDLVNKECAPKVARQHGPQYQLSKVDEAVAGILQTARDENMLTQLDEDAETINKFFKKMLIEMQRRGKFDGTLRINLDVEAGGAWGVFNVALVQLLNRDGTPYVPGEKKNGV